ncbi:MAG TPA: DeoR/GlpR family DNA-binding transcription regulator [Acetobacteraceae bacterium]|nr:DeoR/GlpR family DNA-binding transcription regulator [Acetobacteraceae bacterium]
MPDFDAASAAPPDKDSGASALPALRQTRIGELLHDRGQVTVSELIAIFEVSRDTIRRDLDMMEQHGLLVRTHGGAVRKDQMVRVDTTLNLRMNAHAEAKRRIGAVAAGLVRNGETLLLNGGSSTCAFAAALGKHRDLTIVTNNLRVAPVTPAAAVRAIYVLGGAYWPAQQVTIGPIGLPGVTGFGVDTAVVGVTALSVTGITMGRLDEATETASMIGLARRTIVLADQSKFNSSAFALVASLDRIQHLVADAHPPPDIADALERSGVQLIVAE